MNSETKTCQNCKQNFVIEPEDFVFYEKIKVPPPTWCPECRRQRRLSWRNDFIFYYRNCDLCKKSTISLYAPDAPRVVFCNKCWWSDKWDSKDYAVNYDPSRSFFKQFSELQSKVPTLALVNDNGIASVNCEYTHDFAYGKNCYMTFVAWRVENCLYGYYLVAGKDIVDSMSIFEESNFLYESIFSGRSYRCRNVYYSDNLSNCSFCYDCKDCSDCFLSVGLRHKKYCFKNKQYAKEEYEKILADYRLDTYTGTESAKKEFVSLLTQYPRKFANLKQSVNCTGDDLNHCKNVKNSFNIGRGEDLRFFESGDGPKDSYDITVGGEHNQCYECLTPDHSYRGLFTIYSWKNQEISYCENCHSSKYLFGCAGMKKSSHCILNKQYSEKEYKALKAKIIERMKEDNEWGQFFPSRYSPFGYNETLAEIYFPLEKEDAKQGGFKWQENLQFTAQKETLKSSEIPDSIQDISDNILDEVLSCLSCHRNYRIIPQELTFYREMRIPIPRQCFYCRNRARFAFRNPYKLWHRKCTCGGEKSENGIYQNQTSHFHGSSHCPNEFETSYAPDRPEIVYCEQCYQTEVQ